MSFAQRIASGGGIASSTAPVCCGFAWYATESEPEAVAVTTRAAAATAVTALRRSAPHMPRRYPDRDNSDMTTVSAPSLDSFSPLTGEKIGSVPTVTPDQVQSVVDDVASVQPFWAQLPLTGRARYMKRAAQAILDQLDDLARLLAREQGK